MANDDDNYEEYEDFDYPYLLFTGNEHENFDAWEWLKLMENRIEDPQYSSCAKTLHQLSQLERFNTLVMAPWAMCSQTTSDPSFNSKGVSCFL